MNLTSEQIENYKIKLQNRRAQIVDALKDSAVEGMWNQVVDKYSDQAHFLYEILQNADDAGATKARFILNDNDLVFIHNGKRFFSISDVDSEREDKKKGLLGDINAITSVGQSNKIDSAKIGKFGMGFKSVFQYTKSPFIYDNAFRFKITDYMVPVWLEDDYAGRVSGETVFVFPFDRDDVRPEKAKKEILDKLKNLVLPVLFLHSLESIEYECGEIKGAYSKKCLETEENDNIRAQKYQIINGSKEKQSYLWLFSRTTTDGFAYSVGYFINEQGKLIPRTNFSAFCFFPTKVVTHLNFLVHAPFLLTDSREGIKANSDHNVNMIQRLAELSADALEFFAKIGEKNHNRMIDDDIVKIIPIRKNDFNEIDSDTISFAPFYNVIQKKLELGLLPTNNGCVAAKDACWAKTISLYELVSTEQLQELTTSRVLNYYTRSFEMKKSKKEWVFTSLGQRNNPDLDKYLKEMGVDSFSIDDLLPKMKEPFIESQNVEWLCSLYSLIYESTESTEKAKFRPIFLNEHHKATSAFIRSAFVNQKPEPNLYLSSANSLGYNVVLPDIERNEEIGRAHV